MTHALTSFAVLVVYVVIGLPVSFGIGGRMAAEEWPSLHDRAVWRPEVTRLLQPPPAPRFDTFSRHAGGLISGPTYMFTSGGFTAHDLRLMHGGASVEGDR